MVTVSDLQQHLIQRDSIGFLAVFGLDKYVDFADHISASSLDQL